MSTVIPLDGFEHGTIHAQRGVPIQVHDALALDLERAGLVRIQGSAPAAVEPGNPSAAGEAQQSSASPAARVAIKTTAKRSKLGAKRKARR